MIQIFGSTKCKGTRAAQRFFKDRNVRVQFINLREKGMSKGELESVAKAVGGMSALYAAKSTRAKERGLLHSAPDDARLAKLLEMDAQLLLTPIVRDGAQAVVGDAASIWKSFAEAAKKAG